MTGDFKQNYENIFCTSILKLFSIFTIVKYSILAVDYVSSICVLDIQFSHNAGGPWEIIKFVTPTLNF